MRKVIIIPARLDSKRLPGKLLYQIEGETVLQKCCIDCLRTGYPVYVATPDHRVARELRDCLSMQVENIIRTSPHCRNGTERVAEAANIIGLEDNDIVVDVQADQFGFTTTNFINLPIDTVDKGAELVTVTCPLQERDIDNPNVVKVHVFEDIDEFPVIKWFAREIPVSLSESVDLRRHVGVYATRKNMLDWYVSQPRTKDEKKYSLEQLRWKKAFIACNIKDTPYTIDTLQDVEKMNHVPETEQASTTAQ